MIAILDYNKDYAQTLEKLLDGSGIEAKASMNESILCRAQEIVFPPVPEISGVLRKFHVLNLYSLLRMVKKPVLGIGSGVELMLEYAVEKKESALCYFPELSQRFGIQEEEIKPGLYPVTKTGESLLLQDIPDGTEFYFNFTLSFSNSNIVRAHFSYGIDLPAVCEKNENFGVMFDVLASGDNGLLVMKNFATLAGKSCCI